MRIQHSIPSCSKKIYMRHLLPRKTSFSTRLPGRFFCYLHCFASWYWPENSTILFILFSPVPGLLAGTSRCKIFHLPDLFKLKKNCLAFGRLPNSASKAFGDECCYLSQNCIGSILFGRCYNILPCFSQ